MSREHPPSSAEHPVSTPSPQPLDGRRHRPRKVLSASPLNVTRRPGEVAPAPISADGSSPASSSSRRQRRQFGGDLLNHGSMAQGVLGSPLPKGSDQVDQAVGVVQRSHRQLPFEEIGREVEIEKENGRFISSDDSLFMQMDQLTNLLEQFRIRLEKKKRPGSAAKRTSPSTVSRSSRDAASSPMHPRRQLPTKASRPSPNGPAFLTSHDSISSISASPSFSSAPSSSSSSRRRRPSNTYQHEQPPLNLSDLTHPLLALRLPSPTPDDDRAQDDLNPAALRSDPILPPYLMDDQGPEDGLNWTSLRRERPPQAVTPPPHGTYRPLIEHSALASFRCSTRTEEEIRAEDSISCRGIDDDDDADRNIGSFGGDGGRDGRGRRMRDLICGLLEEEEREEAARSRPDATTVTGGSETLVQRSTLGGTLGGTSSSLGLLEPIDLTSHVGVVAARREMHRPVVEVRRTPAASAGGGQGRWGGRSFGSASSRSAGGGGTDESVGVVVNGPTVNSEAIPRRRDDGARERRSPKDAEREPASSRDSGRQEDRDQPPPLSFMSPHIREPKPSRLSPMLPPRPIASPKMTSPSGTDQRESPKSLLADAPRRPSPAPTSGGRRPSLPDPTTTTLPPPTSSILARALPLSTTPLITTAAALASSTSSSSTPPTIAEMMLLRLQSQTSLPAEMPRILFEPGSGFVSSVDGSAVWGLDEASRESAAAFGYVGGGGGEAGAAGAEEGDTMVMERALRPVMEKYLKGLRVEKAGGGGGGGGGERRKHGAGRIV